MSIKNQTAHKLAFRIAEEKGLETIGEVKQVYKDLEKERPHLFHKTGDYTPLKTERDINDLGNRMAEGNYPTGMSSCEICGINGDCGDDCPALYSEHCTLEEPEEEEVETCECGKEVYRLGLCRSHWDIEHE